MSQQDLVKGQLDVIRDPSSPISASYSEPPIAMDEVEGDDGTSYNVEDGESAIFARN